MLCTVCYTCYLSRGGSDEAGIAFMVSLDAAFSILWACKAAKESVMRVELARRFGRFL